LTLGLAYMVVASLMFAVMGALVYQSKIWEPTTTPQVASFVRVVVNLFFVVVLSYLIQDPNGQRLGWRGLFGDRRSSLWLRGFFGSLSVIAVFYAIQTIGLGETSFLNSSNALWVALLGPWVLGQKNTALGWLAIFMGMIGLYFLFEPDLSHPQTEILGRGIALLSGLFGACAYLMVSKSGRSNHPLCVVFYFTLVSTIVHVVWFLLEAPVWPIEQDVWIALAGAGCAATIAQLFMTKAYQSAPAALVSAVSFTGPVASLAISVLWFDDVPSEGQLLGVMIVLVSGVALPFIQSRRTIHTNDSRQPLS
jgi:drug/metabolite transporter (DMT)-like permease